MVRYKTIKYITKSRIPLKLVCRFLTFLNGGILMEKKNTYGYARVSTISQHDDRQRLAMVEFGVEENFIFTDKQSGKDFDRPAYQELLGLLGAGDTLVVNIILPYLIQYQRQFYEWVHFQSCR